MTLNKDTNSSLENRAYISNLLSKAYQTLKIKEMPTINKKRGYNGVLKDLNISLIPFILNNGGNY